MFSHAHTEKNLSQQSHVCCDHNTPSRHDNVVVFLISLIIVTSSFYYASPLDLYSELGLVLQMCFPQFLLM